MIESKTLPPDQIAHQVLTDFLVDDFTLENPLRILLLEDNYSDAELEIYHLNDITRPFEVKHAPSKEEFYEAFDSFTPHMIISDFQLPQFTGKEALVYVRSKCSTIPFVMCTGRVNEETAVECLKLGADDYVLKDDMNRLCTAVDSAIEKKKSKIQNDRLHKELIKSEANLRAIITNSPSNIYTIDRDGVLLYSTGSRVNTAVLAGTSVYDHTHSKNHENIRRHIHKAFDKKKDVSFEIEGSTEPPYYDWYSCKVGPIMKGDEVEQLVFIPHMITDIRKANLELESFNERLNLLNNHLENVRDEEKKRIAMEIHDQLGQELTGYKLGLYWVKQNLNPENENATSSQEVLEKVDELIELSTQVITTTRRIAHELRPVVLDDIGLIAALEWHIENYNKFRDIECVLAIDTDIEEFDFDPSTALYRIVQEALTNIDKHAQASEAWVHFTSENDEITLRIGDNGKGMNTEKALNSKSMGLFGMRERIKQWNGDFHVESEKGKTEITIKIKLS